MQSIHYLMLAQAALALFAAFYLIRKIRGFIRASVVRFMPIKHRISDESFHMQTRISTIIAYLFGLLLTGLFYWGMDELVQSVLPDALSQQETITITPPAPRPIDLLPRVDSTIEKSKQSVPVPTLKPEPLPIREYDKPPQVSRKSVAASDTYYLQLYAFKDVDLALTQQAIFSDQLVYPVSIRKVIGSFAPYKVIVGPFAHRREVVSLLREQGLEGMVVKASDLQ